MADILNGYKACQEFDINFRGPQGQLVRLVPRIRFISFDDLSKGNWNDDVLEAFAYGAAEIALRKPTAKKHFAQLFLPLQFLRDLAKNTSGFTWDGIRMHKWL